LNLEFKESSFRISLALTLIIYITIILVFNLIPIDENEDLNSKRVYLEFKTIEKKTKKNIEEAIIPKVVKRKISSKNIIMNSNPALNEKSKEEQNTEILDTNLINKKETQISHSDFLDSVVVNYPNLLTFRSLLKEMIKKNPQTETDSAMVVRRMKEYMLKYYKDKYPTPISKFGDANPGIPIEDIFDLFSKKVTVDKKKIKKYLGIDDN